MKLTKILVPIDGGKRSEAAVRAAIGLAACQGGEVTLLHCHDRIPALIGGDARDDLEVELMEEDAELLRPYADMLAKAGCAPRLLARGGDPGDLIARVADTGGYDLVIMGTQGYTRIGGFILGSVVQQVLSATECPVLVVH